MNFNYSETENSVSLDIEHNCCSFNKIDSDETFNLLYKPKAGNNIENVVGFQVIKNIMNSHNGDFLFCKKTKKEGIYTLIFIKKMTLKHLSKVLNIILIDDDVIQLFLNEIILKENSIISEIVSFSIPAAALEYIYKLKDTDFENQIILLDLNMPVMTGWEVLENLKIKYGESLPSNAKICILSSSDLTEDINKSKKYKIVSGFYTKPLDKLKVDKILETFIS